MVGRQFICGSTKPQESQMNIYDNGIRSNLHSIWQPKIEH